MTNWFKQLTGFEETTPEQVRSMLYLDDNWLVSRANQQRWYCGTFHTFSLRDLYSRLGKINSYSLPALKVSEQVANVQDLHADPKNAGALFQVASQFNMLEMAAPGHTPEMGVGIYQHDNTQGPACAIAAGAGTIWRNYFMPLPGQTGQSKELQFDALSLIGKMLGNSNDCLWRMQNGYVASSLGGLKQISNAIKAAKPHEYDALKEALRTGWQADTQGTLPGCNHRVHPLYCSALPVAYSKHPPELWEPFARLILEAAYEATLAVAVSRLQEGFNKVYLTLLGGGAFGNKTEWIIDAIRKALHKFSGFELDVVIVSYLKPKAAVTALVEEITQVFSERHAEHKAAQEAYKQVKKPKQLSVDEKKEKLNEIVDSWNAITAHKENYAELFACPVCHEYYQHHGQAMTLQQIIERINFIQRYNSNVETGGLAMPVCYDCEQVLDVKSPWGLDEGRATFEYNGITIERLSKFGGRINWVYI